MESSDFCYYAVGVPGEHQSELPRYSYAPFFYCAENVSPAFHAPVEPSVKDYNWIGKYAFVPSSFTPGMDVIDKASYKVIARVAQVSPILSNLAADQDRVRFTLKDSGKTQVVSAKPVQAIDTMSNTVVATNPSDLSTRASDSVCALVAGEIAGGGPSVSPSISGVSS